ncbi:DUF2065 family protein [Xanthomonas sp. AmX2]|nr:DUF2065 family protein [Xanthomonas sp.]
METSMRDLFAALCLIAVLEGLVLLVAPDAWRRMAVQLLSLPTRQVRVFGAVTLVLGLLALWIVRH